MPTTSTTASSDSTVSRILDATSLAVAQYGPRKLNLTDIAALAGVSRPTLYRYFASKEELLAALSVHEQARYETELAAAIRGVTGPARLKRALRFILDFQRDYPMRGLVLTEPAFMLEQLERALQTMATALIPLIEEASPTTGPGAARPGDIADLIVRVALSHFLIRGDDAQLLRELQHVAGLRG
jgi:AcrR family transcriptional regulator